MKANRSKSINQECAHRDHRPHRVSSTSIDRTEAGEAKLIIVSVDN